MLTLKQAAERYPITHNALASAHARGALACEKRGGELYVETAEVVRYLNEKRTYKSLEKYTMQHNCRADVADLDSPKKQLGECDCEYKARLYLMGGIPLSELLDSLNGNSERAYDNLPSGLYDLLVETGTIEPYVPPGGLLPPLSADCMEREETCAGVHDGHVCGGRRR